MSDLTTRGGLTSQSLTAAVVAAYAGAVFVFVIDMTRRIYLGSDASICPADSGFVCRAGEYALAYLLTLWWAVFALPVALILCLPVAFGLARLAPRLEQSLSPPAVRSSQYAAAGMSGIVVMVLIDALFGGRSLLPMAATGLFTAVVAVFQFRRLRYR